MRIRAAATAVLIAVAGLACVQSDEGPADATLAHTISVLEGLIQEELDAGVPSISLSLLVGDEVVWSGAYGYANVGLKAPATTESLYNTASTLKPVTATAVLTLVEQGRLGLDDPVNRYLGEHPVMDDPPNSVTVRSLLDHTSGLSDELGQTMTSVLDRRRPQPVGLQEIPATMKTRWPVGERWRYNNSAYAVAGLLIEKLSGISYEEYIVTRVLAPLGVTAAHPVNPDAAMAEMMTFPYLEDPDGSFRPAAGSQTDLYPAGDAWVRPQDMIRFLGAHLNEGVFEGERILSGELVEEAHRANMEDYGLGWWTRVDEKGHRLILHGGMGYGYSVTMIGDKDARVGVYAMANASTQANYPVDYRIRHLLDAGCRRRGEAAAGRGVRRTGRARRRVPRAGPMGSPDRPVLVRRFRFPGRSHGRGRHASARIPRPRPGLATGVLSRVRHPVLPEKVARPGA